MMCRLHRQCPSPKIPSPKIRSLDPRIPRSRLMGGRIDTHSLPPYPTTRWVLPIPYSADPNTLHFPFPVLCSQLPRTPLSFATAQLYIAMQCRTQQSSAIQSSAIQPNAAQYSALQPNAVQWDPFPSPAPITICCSNPGKHWVTHRLCGTVQWCTVLCALVRWCTVHCALVRWCTVGSVTLLELGTPDTRHRHHTHSHTHRHSCITPDIIKAGLAAGKMGRILWIKKNLTLNFQCCLTTTKSAS